MRTCSNCYYATKKHETNEYRCDDTYEIMPKFIADNTVCKKWTPRRNKDEKK